jgi:hypothetical protein
MSTSRDTKKNDREKVSSQSEGGNSLRIQQEQQQQEKVIHKVLDDTKENIRKTLSEARKEIPRYTQVVNDYQENTIQAIREITDNYVESQKDIIINSLRLWSDWMVSPGQVAENYGKIASSFADNAIAATRVLNNSVFANLKSFNTSVQHTTDNVKELSRIGANTVKTFEAISRNSINTRITAKTSE